MKEVTPNQVLGDVITQETYHVERKGDDKDDKKKEEEKKKKSMTFKASSSSSKNKGKSKKESSDDDDLSDIDDEAMPSLSTRWENSWRRRAMVQEREEIAPRAKSMWEDATIARALIML